MKSNLALSLVGSLLSLSAAAAIEPAAEPRALGVESSIVFPNDSSIRNWRADKDRGIWIQDRRGDWFYGSFSGICRDLDFANAIGVETQGASRLDRYASIVVRGEKCRLVSFVTSEGPPTNGEKTAGRETGSSAQN